MNVIFLSQSISIEVLMREIVIRPLLQSTESECPIKFVYVTSCICIVSLCFSGLSFVSKIVFLCCEDNQQNKAKSLFLSTQVPRCQLGIGLAWLFPLGIIVFDKHELILHVSQGLTLLIARVVSFCFIPFKQLLHFTHLSCSRLISSVS